MTAPQPLPSTAKAPSAPNKPDGEGGYVVALAHTPRRDIDLFGPTTVRIDARVAPGDAPGAPLIYLSAFVTNPERLARRIVAALDWAYGRAPTTTVDAVAVSAEPAPALYTLPEYVEDVEWSERLFLPEDLTTTDWTAWSAALLCRIRLATSSRHTADLLAANADGVKLAPGRIRARIGGALQDVAAYTADQSAA